jgi:mRNA-degrading endonuclease toxin of MazEF toxin-antitoxin module
MERGDIYLVTLDPSSGHEQQGIRPVLVISATAFNHLTKTPVVLPITSKGGFARTAGFAVSLEGCGTKTTGVVRCDQPRAIDLASRHARKLERAPESIVDDALGRFSAIFQ